MSKVNEPVYQLKVTLKGTQPPVWRRIQVHANVTLHRLHLILQATMSWKNYHLYRFEIAGTEYGDPDPEVDFTDSRKTRLGKVVTGENTRFIYEYDFGDGWNHEILIEKIFPAESTGQYPVCLAGERTCPPEDCGGIGGYADLLRIISGPKNKRYKEMMDWLGGPFDPEEFDIVRVNRALARFRPKDKKNSKIPAAFRRAFETED